MFGQGTRLYRLRKSMTMAVLFVAAWANMVSAVTWTDNKPAVGNNIADDIGYMRDNFTYLHTLLENYYKTLSDSSADIGKTAMYYVDSTETDQGTTNAIAGMDRGVKELVDAIGTSKRAILYFPHAAASANTTTYQFITAEEIPSNITVIMEAGALIDTTYSITDGGSTWTWSVHSGNIYKLEQTPTAVPIEILESDVTLTKVSAWWIWMRPGNGSSRVTRFISILPVG